MTKKELQNSAMTYAMTGLVIVAAYFLGVYKTKSEMLLAGDVKSEEDSVVVQEEQAPTNLDDEDWLRVQENPAAVLGSDNAPVVMVEYTDYKCPYCAEFAGYDAISQFPTDEEQVFENIRKNYINTGKVKYIVHDQTAIHGVQAIELAEVARCAGDQGKYFEMHDLLFEGLSDITSGKDDKMMQTYASKIGLDLSEFNSCLDGDKYEDAVKRDSEIGTEVGATGTPTFFINGEYYVGAQPYAVFEEVIEAFLQ